MDVHKNARSLPASRALLSDATAAAATTSRAPHLPSVSAPAASNGTLSIAPNATNAEPRKRTVVMAKPTKTEIGIVRLGVFTSDAITAMR